MDFCHADMKIKTIYGNYTQVTMKLMSISIPFLQLLLILFSVTFHTVKTMLLSLVSLRAFPQLLTATATATCDPYGVYSAI